MAVAAAYQMVIEEVRFDLMMAVQKCTITDFGRLNRIQSFSLSHRLAKPVL